MVKEGLPEKVTLTPRWRELCNVSESEWVMFAEALKERTGQVWGTGRRPASLDFCKNGVADVSVPYIISPYVSPVYSGSFSCMLGQHIGQARGARELMSQELFSTYDEWVGGDMSQLPHPSVGMTRRHILFSPQSPRGPHWGWTSGNHHGKMLDKIPFAGFLPLNASLPHSFIVPLPDKLISFFFKVLFGET